MDRNKEINIECRQGRRRFLTVFAAAGAGFAAAGSGNADTLTKTQRDNMTPDEIIRVMKAGNERFRGNARVSRDYIAEQTAAAKGQHPAAVILSCIDSRAPAEVILDLGIGDVFNSRVAGNISNDDILGSMEFACKVAGAKVVLVMGHTACGAVQGAIDGVKLGNLTGLLAKIQPAVGATIFPGDRSSSNPDFVDAVARKNVELTIASIRRNSTILRDLESAKTIKIVGAIYNLGTGGVDFFS
uniref:Carbonic anhydrase n=1 Tax=Solibacter usitatus (strain Ellin6076) TaxID=234267 RepID=Q01UB7_SOLUE